jgi:predicted esterase
MFKRWLFSGLLVCLCSFEAFSQVVTTEFVLDRTHRELANGDVDPVLCPDPPDNCHCKPNAQSNPIWDTGWTGPFKEAKYVGRDGVGWPKEFMNWRFIYPLNYDENRAEPYPMIVMLHGAGEVGRKGCCGVDYKPTDIYYDNNGRNVGIGGQAHKSAVDRNPALSNSFPGIVMWPQTTYAGAWESGWANGDISDNNRMVSEIIQYMIRTRNIDPDRIVMHGLSNGAQGVWDLATKRSDLFAGILPMSGVGTDLGEMVNSLVTMPIWIFQGSTDLNPNPSASLSWLDAFVSAGGNMIRTVYQGVGHGTWNNAYGEANFFPWIKARSKRNIHVFGGIPAVCQGGQLKLGFSEDMVEYLWTKDGLDIDGSNDRFYFVTQPGTYTVKYRRQEGAFRADHPNPQYAEWGESFPLVVGDAGVSTYVPPLTNTGSVNLTINQSGTDNRIVFTAPPGMLLYSWYKDGNLITGTPPTINKREISSNTGAAIDAGTYTVRVLEPTGCTSLMSNPIVVTWNASQPTSPKPTPPTMTVVGEKSVNVTWPDYSGETGYEIWRTRFGLGPAGYAGTICSTPPGFYSMENWKLIKVLPAGTTSYLDNTLRAGQAWYRYRVRAILSTGQAIFSDEPNSVAETPVDLTPPSVPTSLTASNLTSTGVTLTWTPSSDNDYLYGYEVYNGSTLLALVKASAPLTGSCAGQTTNPTQEGTLPAPSTYVVTGLVGNMTYNFSVRALDWKGNYSAFSEPIDVTPQLFAGTTGWDWKFYTYSGVSLPNLSTFDYDQNPGWISFTSNSSFVAAPAGIPSSNNYVLVAESYIDIVAANVGTTIFYTDTNASEASMLYIDNDGTGYKLVVDNNNALGAERSGSINFETAGRYKIKVIFADLINTESLVVRWDPPNASKQTLPSARLFRLNRTFYYLRSDSAGDDPAVVSAWTPVSTGVGGISPANFTGANAYYVLSNRANVTLNAAWTIGGAGSRVVVGNGSTTPVTLDLNAAITGRLEANRNSTINANTATMPTFGTLESTSTVNFNADSDITIPPGIYGNVNLTRARLYTLPMNVTQVLGNLDVIDGATTTGASNNFSLLRVGGNITFHNSSGSPLPATPAATYGLSFFGGGNHTVSFTTPVDPNFFSIQTDIGDAVTFSNAGVHTYTFGTTQGGGIMNRGTITLGDNSIVVSGRGTINANTETGEIAISGGNLTLNSTATASSSIYLSGTNNTVNNLSLTVPATFSVGIMNAANVSNLVSLTGGILNSNDGGLTLVSNASGTARIAPLSGTARVTGTVTAQRYMEGEGTIYRYISMPVKGVKVADLQNYFPVTGNFTGASTGPGLNSNPSLFSYAESTGYVQFPPLVPAPATNQDTLRTGRGYSGYIREGVNPTTWQVKGALNQGNVSYNLTPGTGATDGWNLVGNPYPAPIKWTGNSTGGWTMSGMNNTVSVRENYSATEYRFRTWNGTSGNLANGIIAPGQAYWVQTTNGSPSLTIGETAKQVTDGIFYKEGGPENVIAVKMKSGSREDDAYIQFDRNATLVYEKQLDALKQSNSYFNLSTLTSDGKSVAINLTTSGQCDQTISFRTSNVANGNYQLILSGVGSLVAGEQVTFMDTYTNTTVTLGVEDYTHSFSVTSVAASKADGRFKLKFTKPGVTYENTLASDAACNNSDPVVLIHNSQPGVDYKAFVNGVAVSNVGVGNGGNLTLPVNHTMLPYGKTNIQLTAGFLGCQQYDLTNTVNVTRDTVAIPDITMNQGVLSSDNMQGVEYQWLFEGEVIEGAVTGEFTPIDSGAYTVEIRKASCVLTSEVFVKKPLYLNLPLSSESVCNTDAVVVVQNSQPGAKYKAFFGSIDASSYVVGTGGSISIPLDASVILSGQKDIQVQVGFENDLPKFLANNILVERDVLGTPLVLVDGTKLKTNVTGNEFKWYLNGSLIPDATGNEIDFTAEGNYSVQVASGLCSAMSETVPLSFTIKTDLAMNSQAQCDSNSIVTIEASQPGVTYAAYDNGSLVSDEVIGTGGTITLTVNTAIGFGQKQLTVKAGYLNAEKHALQSTITVNRLFLATPNVSTAGTKLTVDVQDAQYKWFLNGVELQGENSSTIEPSESGSYYAEVSNGVCTRQSLPVSYAVTGVGDELPARLTLSPNPARSRIVVETPQPIVWSTIRLSTATGQGFHVPMTKLGERSIEMDISGLTPGFYLVHVNGETVRLVKE